LEGRDDTPLDLLSGLPGSFARPTILSPGLIKVRSKSVTFDRCRLKEGLQLFESLSGLLYLIN
jgi:hypothetical protein